MQAKKIFYALRLPPLLLVLSLLFAVLCPLTSAFALMENQNLFVTTGRDSTEDSFHKFIFYLEADSNFTGKLFVRVFDADLGGVLDISRPDSKVLYQLFATDAIDREQRNMDEPVTDSAPLASLELGKSKFYDNQWRTIATLDLVNGKLVDGRGVFQLVVDGISGEGGNKFQLFISGEEKRNTAVPGVRLSSPAVNLQLPATPAMESEVRFTVPVQSKFVKITNFDADSVRYDARVYFASRERTNVPLQLSKNKSASTTELLLLDDERGQPVAVVFSSAKLNFVQLWINDEQDNGILLDLPVFLAPSNTLPEPSVAMTPLSDCGSVMLDASGSTDKDDDELRFQWYFDDNSMTEGSRITHDFKQPGQYIVTLVAQDDSGFVADSSRFDIPVVVNARPRAVITAPAGAATGEKVTFNAGNSVDPDGKIIHYRWEFGEGSRKTGSTVEHIFSRPGLYRVTLQVEDDGNGLCTRHRVSHDIGINSAPIAKFNARSVAAPGEKIRLDASGSSDSDGTIVDYRWDFGDNDEGNGKTIEHSWQQPGVYTVQLQVVDSSGLASGSDIETRTIKVNGQPKAVFSTSTLVTAANDEVSFNADKSYDDDGKIIAYVFDFDDNIVAKGVAVNHAFSKPGLYTVRLTVTDNSDVANATSFSEQTVRVNQPPVPVAGVPQTLNSSLVDFDGSGSTDVDDVIIKYHWDFGDGHSGEGVSVSHVYAMAGTYTAQLSVTDGSGSSSAVQTAETRVTINHPPLADAGVDLTIAKGDTVNLDGGLSIDPDGEIKSYSWEIAGITVDQQTVSHRFERPGRYQVRLTVVDNHDASHSDVANITVNSRPIARFAPLARIEPGRKITFNGSGSSDADGKIIGYNWDFGDGDSGGGKRVKHAFAEPGRYRIVLTVRDNAEVSNDTATATATISVNYPPVADAGEDIHTCGQLVLLEGSASTDTDRDPLSYSWDFGDSAIGMGTQVMHQFAHPGIYPVTLTVDDNMGLENSRDTSSITVHVNEPPEAVIQTGGDLFCAGEHVLFDGSGSSDPEGSPLRYFWDLGDGQKVEDANPIRAYARGGDYVIGLSVLDDSGLACNAGYARKAIHVVDAPIAVAGEDIEVCANTPVEFDGSASSGGGRPVISYDWNFGDGGGNVGAKTSHVYSEAGFYVARLTIQAVNSGQCENRSEDERKVKVFSSPRADFTTTDGCPGEPVAFDAASSVKFNSGDGSTVGYSWDFGDNLSGEGETTEHLYALPGEYLAQLKVTTSDDTACNSAESTRSVRINHQPQAHINLSEAGKKVDDDQQVFSNTLLQFSAAGSNDPDGAIKIYSWDFGDNDTATGCFVDHSFTGPGVYTVRVTVEDDSDVFCNQAEAEMQVTVEEYPVRSISGPERVCVQQEVEYSLDGDDEKVSWRFGDGNEAKGQRVRKSFDMPGVYEINTMINDLPGPARTIQAAALPHLVLPDRVQVIAGEELLLSPVPMNKTDVQPSFHWDMGDGTLFDQAEAHHIYAEAGRYRPRLTITGIDGLPCLKDDHTVAVTVLARPMANISHTPDQIYAGGARDEVEFRAALAGGAGAWNFHWDFGDREGGSGEGAVVSYSFKKPGLHVVTLTLSDGSGVARKPYVFTAEVEVKGRE